MTPRPPPPGARPAVIRSGGFEPDVRKLRTELHESMAEERRQAEAAWSETQKQAKAALESLVEDLSVIQERTGTGAGSYGIHRICDKPWSAKRLAKITRVAELVHEARIESERKRSTGSERSSSPPTDARIVASSATIRP